MTVNECVEFIKQQAESAGMMPAEFTDRINNATREEIATALESLSTDALEWAVKFAAELPRQKQNTCIKKQSQANLDS